MMKSLGLEKENIIKDIKNLLRRKNELNYTAIENITDLFRLEKETKASKHRILWDIKNHFEHEKEEENNYKPVRLSNFWCNEYIEYEYNDDSNKTLPVDKFFNNIRPYLQGIAKNFKKSDT